MADTPTPATTPSIGRRGARIRAGRRLRSAGPAVRWLALVVLLAVVALVAAAVIPGSHHPARFGVARTARRVTTVFGARSSARRYGTEIGRLENQGVNAQGQLTSSLTPLPASAFKAPIAHYRVYAEHWAVQLSSAVKALQTTLASGDRASAERTWTAAFFDFMHLGADYNLLPTSLTNALARVPSQLGEKNFPGLHRIEMGLWTGEPLRSLLPAAAGVATAASKLRRILPTVPINTLDYTLRIHEILEDAQRDLMSGAEVPWSGAGVIGTEAGVVATRELLSTVAPILQGRDGSYVASRNWLDQLQQVLLSVRHATGAWPTVSQLTTVQRERIDGTLAGTLGALEQVPGALETTAITGFPSIPRHSKR